MSGMDDKGIAEALSLCPKFVRDLSKAESGTNKSLEHWLSQDGQSTMSVAVHSLNTQWRFGLAILVILEVFRFLFW